MLNNSMAEMYTNADDYGTYYYKDPRLTIRHREDGPAVEWADGDKEWFVNGNRHRLDGPAVVYTSGYQLWYVDDIFIFAVDKGGKIVNRLGK